MKLARIPILILFALASASIAYSEQPRGSESPVQIGVLLCLSGNCADWGSAALKGVRLAVDEINKTGGVLNSPIDIKVEDTREAISGAEAVTAFKKLVELDRLKFIIGPSWSPGALAIAPLIAKNQDIIAITPSASAEQFNKSGPNLFNMRPPARLATEGLANFAFRNGWRKSAVFTSQQPAEATQGEIFRNEFQKIGGKITRYIETVPTSTNVKSEALEIVRSNPDAVFLMAYNQMDLASSALRKLGFKGSLLAISVDDSRVQSAKGALESAYISKAASPTNEFQSKFRATFNEEPGLSAENGYDSVIALASAIQEAGTMDRTIVAKRLAKTQISGASGRIKFDENRAVVQQPVLYRVESGKLVSIKSGAAG